MIERDLYHEACYEAALYAINEWLNGGDFDISFNTCLDNIRERPIYIHVYDTRRLVNIVW